MADKRRTTVSVCIEKGKAVTAYYHLNRVRICQAVTSSKHASQESQLSDLVNASIDITMAHQPTESQRLLSYASPTRLAR